MGSWHVPWLTLMLMLPLMHTVDTTAGKRGKLPLMPLPNLKPMPKLLPKPMLMPMPKLMLMDMVMAVDTDMVDTVADTMARDPLMLNLSLMPLPITVDTMVLVDTTAVDTMVVTDMAVLDTTAVDTMDVKGGPLKVMPKPTMVDIPDMVDTADMEATGMVMAVDMATTDNAIFPLKFLWIKSLDNAHNLPMLMKI